MQSFWDFSYIDGDHVEHWEDPDPGRTIDHLHAAGWLPSAGRAVDVGCGGGLDALQLATHGLDVIGLDNSVGALHVAVTRGARRPALTRRVIWCRSSVLVMPLATASVDLVHDRGCFHCLDEAATRRRYATEVHRVLRAGGRWIVTGARIDDDERGVTAVDGRAIERFFPKRSWTVEHVEQLDLVAPAGSLPACRAVLGRN
ncbi:MAG: class I SAM-dependent methyltransferase [Acidobacteriota bacterium]